MLNRFFLSHCAAAAQTIVHQNCRYAQFKMLGRYAFDATKLCPLLFPALLSCRRMLRCVQVSNLPEERNDNDRQCEQFAWYNGDVEVSYQQLHQSPIAYALAFPSFKCIVDLWKWQRGLVMVSASQCKTKEKCYWGQNNFLHSFCIRIYRCGAQREHLFCEFQLIERARIFCIAMLFVTSKVKLDKRSKGAFVFCYLMKGLF